MDLVHLFRLAKISLTSGVPCSHLGDSIERLTERGVYVSAANEGAALAVAAGATLAGGRGAVVAQNSGLGNMLNPLASVLLPAQIPGLAVVTMRGWPDPLADEPQHAVMGRSTQSILGALGVPYRLYLAGDEDDVVTDAIEDCFAMRTPRVLLLPMGVLAPSNSPSPRQSRWAAPQALAAVLPAMQDAAVITTTGYLSRFVSASFDRDTNFYLQGGMGHAGSLGLGVALSRPDQRVMVIDGDGAFLMHLGSAATIGAYRPKNLTHVVVDNGSYESTGGQASTSRSLSWTELGAGLSYRYVAHCCDEASTLRALAHARTIDGPHLIVLNVDTHPSAVPPRATATASWPDLAERFATSIQSQ